MEVRMGRVLERVSGVGEIYAGETPAGKATYTVTVFQRTARTGTFGATDLVDGQTEIRGVVEPDDEVTISELMNRDDLTLRMNDGRRWDFALVDAEGTAVNTHRDEFYRP